VRKEIYPGVYEKVGVNHSWNAPYFFSNLITYKLQRHSDHHENSFKEY
jgi:alkane 1-monooxygenase